MWSNSLVVRKLWASVCHYWDVPISVSPLTEPLLQTISSFTAALGSDTVSVCVCVC